MRNAAVYIVATTMLGWLNGLLAADLDEVAAQIEAGQYQAALDGLASTSVSSHARLLRANALGGLGRKAEAEAIYLDLIEERPRDPAPYNNLATLYAAQGRLQEASQLLEQAMQSDPRYAAVHRNLSRIYVEMSSQAYAKALRLKEGQQEVHLLSLDHRDVVEPPLLQLASRSPQRVAAAAVMPKMVVESPPPAESPATPIAATPAKPLIASRRELPPAAASRPEPVAVKVTQRTAATVTAAPVEQIAATPRGAPVETISVAAPVPEEPLVAVSPVAAQKKSPPAFDAGGAIAALKRWAARWSAQDVAGYLDSYDRNFQPANGLSREQWRSQRERRLRKPGSIKVRLSDYEVATTETGGLLVKALQYYRSDNYSDSSRKGFVLVDTADGWKIREEYTIEVLN